MKPTNHEQLARISELPSIERGERGDQGYLQLWYALARRSWQSLVLVPGRPGGSADEAARLLAEVGEKVRGLPVRAITMSSLDYGTAFALADLQERIRRLTHELGREREAIEVTPGRVDAVGPGWVMGGEPSRQGPGPQQESIRGEASPEPPSGGTFASRSPAQFVISIPCLLTEPLGLSATQAADAVVVLVELGRTKMADVQRIVDQVGSDRVVGCILVN